MTYGGARAADVDQSCAGEGPTGSDATLDGGGRGPADFYRNLSGHSGVLPLAEGRVGATAVAAAVWRCADTGTELASGVTGTLFPEDYRRRFCISRMVGGDRPSTWAPQLEDAAVRWLHPGSSLPTGFAATVRPISSWQ